MIVMFGSIEAGRVDRCANICATHPRFTSTGRLDISINARGDLGPVVSLDGGDDMVS